MSSLTFLGGIGRYAWFRSGPILLGCAASVFAICVGFQIWPTLPAQALLCTILIFIAITLISTLTFADQVEIGRSAFPKQLLLLPTSSARLAVTCLVFGFLILGILGLVVDVVALTPRFGHENSWWTIPYLLASLSLFQAVYWKDYSRPWLAIVVALVPISLIVGAPAVIAAHFVQPPLLGWGCLIVTPISTLYAIRSLSEARISLRAGEAQTSQKIPYRRPFRSPMEAQVWIEVQRNGLIGTVLVILMCFLLGCMALFTVPSGPTLQINGKSMSQTALMIAGTILYISLMVGSMSGCCASAADNVTKRNELNPFLALRPMTTAQLIEAKMRMAAITLGRFMGLSIVTALLVLFIPCKTNTGFTLTILTLVQTVSWSTVLKFLAGYLIFLVGAYKGMISNIWMGIGRLHAVVRALATILPLTVFLLLMIVPLDLYSHPEHMGSVIRWVQFGAVVLVGLKILATVFTTHRLQLSGLVSNRTIVGWTTAWIAVGFVCASCAFQLQGLTSVSLWSLLGSQILALPFARVALTPMLVDANRHQ